MVAINIRKKTKTALINVRREMIFQSENRTILHQNIFKRSTAYYQDVLCGSQPIQPAE